jgi:hypothetical protein
MNPASPSSPRPAPSLKFAPDKKDAAAISIDEAAERMGVTREEAIECIRRGKLETTTRLDEICVLWPEGAGDARENKITTDSFADPKHSEDPKWLHSVIGGSMLVLFFIAGLYLFITIVLSMLRPATTGSL